jgi:hypothetical protein
MTPNKTVEEKHEISKKIMLAVSDILEDHLPILEMDAGYIITNAAFVLLASIDNDKSGFTLKASVKTLVTQLDYIYGPDWQNNLNGNPILRKEEK